MCTGIFLRTKENEYLFSRTLEFVYHLIGIKYVIVI